MRTKRNRYNETVTVDDIDEDLLYSASVTGKVGNRYATWHGREENGEKCQMLLHRAIMVRVIGCPIPDGMVTDHINGDTLDNRRDNLRLCTRTQNNYNRRTNTENATGFKGVSKRPSGRFRACIKIDGVNKNLGTYDTPEEANAVYVEAAKRIAGNFANDGNGALILGGTE